MSKIKVWDGVTRLFHIGLIVAFCLSLYSAFEDKFGIWADVHLWSGVTVLALVGWRILYGIFGSETNLFHRFVKGPVAVFRGLRALFLGRPGESIGHGAPGGWSVVAMVSLLLVQAGLGLFASDDMFFSGPLADQRDMLPVARPTSLHETLGYVLMGLVGLHVATVLLYRLKGRYLITPMITGRATTKGPAPRMRHWAFGFLSLILVVGAVFWPFL